MSRSRRIAFVFVSWFAVLILAEIAARLVLAPGGPLISTALDAVPNLRAKGWFRSHPTLFWELLPNLDRTWSRWGDRTNSLGFRGPHEPGEEAASTRVLCLGDSCTYGLGLPWNLTWPARLDEVDGLEVLNAGVPGYSSHQGRALFVDRGKALDPDVLVLQFGTNDANLWPIRKDAVMHCLADREVARHLLPRGIGRFSALAAVVDRLLTPPESTPVPDFSEVDHGRAPPRVTAGELVANLRALAEEVPRTVVLIWPLRRHFDPAFTDPVPAERSREYREALRGMAGDDVFVIDLHEVFARSGLPSSVIFADGVHATAKGARLVADEVGRAIRGR